MLSIIEIFALVFIMLAALKITVISISPKFWFNSVVKKLWLHEHFMLLTSLILSGVIFYYLLKELSIIHILAVMLFTFFFTAVGISMYSKEILKTLEKFYLTDYFVEKSLPYILLWIILLLWGLKEIFL